MSTEETARRLAVVNLRHRVELIAVAAVRGSFSSETVSVEQIQIVQRLAFIPIAYGKNAPMAELLGMVRMTRHIYKRSSDALHGRSNMVNLSDSLVDEWTILIERVEELSEYPTEE